MLSKPTGSRLCAFLGKEVLAARSHLFGLVTHEVVGDAVIGQGSGQAGRPSSPAAFLGAARCSKLETHGSVGLGTDVRLEGAGVIGSALVHQGNVIHLSLFAQD